MSNIDELVGLWDSSLFGYGSMEAGQLAVLADGSGWGVWTNAARGMELTLFEWHRLDVSRFCISDHQLISGTWDPDRPGCILCDEAPMSMDVRTQFHYELVTQVPPLADSPELTLILDKAFQFTRSYALVRRDVVDADRPTVINRYV
jgi:hypothetical protein